MTFDPDFFTKAQVINDTHRKAVDGRKLGTSQDFGVFLGPDAPAHIKNQLHPLPTAAEWSARMERDAADPIIQKYGPGMTVLNLYVSLEDSRGINNNSTPLLDTATAEEVRILWDRWFQRHGPQYKHGPYTPKFTAALKAEAARRGVNVIFK